MSQSHLEAIGISFFFYITISHSNYCVRLFKCFFQWRHSKHWKGVVVECIRRQHGSTA